MCDGTKFCDSNQPQSCEHWCEYFRSNAERLLPIPWEIGVNLSHDEHLTIAASIQEFQLGESSEGKTFAKMAREYAHQSGDLGYIVAQGLFIAEEHRHARDLGRVMDLAGIPRVSKTAADGAFRWMRKLAGLEVSIGVLVTAEIIARVYYDALLRATRSPVLQTLCRQILQDEILHIQFQTERLALMRQSRGRVALIATHLMHRLAMSTACGVVWLKHKNVLRAGGFGIIRYWLSVRREFGLALRSMDPRRYAFARPAPQEVLTAGEQAVAG